MLNKLNATLLTAAALLLASPAAADHDRPYRYAPTPADVAEVAHELERAARHVHRTAEKYLHGHGRFEWALLESLHRLDDRARHFHRTYERHGRGSRHLDRDFAKLWDAYDTAAYHMDHVRSRHLRDDFRTVARLVHRLERVYAASAGHGHDPRYDAPHAYPGRSRGSIDYGRDRHGARYRVYVRW